MKPAPANRKAPFPNGGWLRVEEDDLRDPKAKPSLITFQTHSELLGGSGPRTDVSGSDHPHYKFGRGPTT